MTKELNLPPGTKEIHVFEERLAFPVFIYVTNDWDKTQVTYLTHNFNNSKNFTVCELCQWCENHQLTYQIIYYRNPLEYIFRDYKRFLCYLYIKYKGF